MSERRPLILVVEDDESVQSLMQLLLTSEGYEVVAAKDGLEGLVKLDREHPSLVILDLMMPNVSGDRMFEELRSDPRLKDVPIIVVSGRHDVHGTFDPLIGPANVFPKPIDPAALIDRVAEILDR